MIAGFVLVSAAHVAGAAMLLMAGGEPKQQPAPLLMAVAGEIFPVAEPKPGPELRFVNGADQPGRLPTSAGRWCS
jgi:hypothetical protein